MFLVFLLFALFATIFSLGKLALLTAAPIFYTGARMVFAGSILMGYHYWQERTFRFGKADLLDLAWLTVFNIYLTNVCEFIGLQNLSAAKASFIYNLTPFFSALLSYCFFNEVMTRKKWLALCAGFLGFLPVLVSQTAHEENLCHFFFLSSAEFLLICAAGATVIGWISMRRLVLNGYPSILANGISMFLGGIMSFITSAYLEGYNPLPIYQFWPFVGYVVLLALISNIICYNLYGYLLKRYTATFMTFAGLTSPFFAAFFGWLFLGETVDRAFFISSAIVLSALYIFYQEELAQGYIVHDSSSWDV